MILTDPPTDDDGIDAGDGTDGGTDGSGDPTVGGGTTEPSISVAGGASFTIGGNAVNPGSSATISQSSLGANITSATISIQNFQEGDTLRIDNLPAGLEISPTSAGENGESIVIRIEAGAEVTDDVFETAIANVLYSYEVPVGVTPVTTTRIISYTVNDGINVSTVETSLVTIVQ